MRPFRRRQGSRNFLGIIASRGDGDGDRETIGSAPSDRRPFSVDKLIPVRVPSSDSLNPPFSTSSLRYVFSRLFDYLSSETNFNRLGIFPPPRFEIVSLFRN